VRDEMATILERHTFARLVQQEEEKRRSHASRGPEHRKPA
jgi:hypothetical protein